MTDMKRRTIIRTGVAATGAVWVAPAVVGLDLASAATSGPPTPPPVECPSPVRTTTDTPLAFTLENPEVSPQEVTQTPGCVDVYQRVTNPSFVAASVVEHPEEIATGDAFTSRVSFVFDPCALYHEVRDRFEQAAADSFPPPGRTISDFSIILRNIRTIYPIPAGTSLVSASLVTGPPGTTIETGNPGVVELIVAEDTRTESTPLTCTESIVIDLVLQHDGVTPGPVDLPGPGCTIDELEETHTQTGPPEACGIIVRNWRDEGLSQPTIARVQVVDCP